MVEVVARIETIRKAIKWIGNIKAAFGDGPVLDWMPNDFGGVPESLADAVGAEEDAAMTKGILEFVDDETGRERARAGGGRRPAPR